MVFKALAYLLPIKIRLPTKIDLGDGIVIREISKSEKEQKLSNGLFSLRGFDFDNLKYIEDRIFGLNWLLCRIKSYCAGFTLMCKSEFTKTFK